MPLSPVPWHMVGVQKIVIFPSSFRALFSLKSFCTIEKCEFHQEYTFILEIYAPLNVSFIYGSVTRSFISYSSSFSSVVVHPLTYILSLG